MSDRPDWRIVTGDARERLRELDDGAIQTCITSPPYYGLRDYGTTEWEGGDPSCQHLERELRRGVNLSKSAASTRGGGVKAAEVGWLPFKDECGHCGAVRIDRQIGLEPTVEEYVQTLVELFREVRRVLRDDGTLWLNIGDSYAGSWGAQSRGEGPKISELSRLQADAHPKSTRTGSIPKDAPYKPKDLIGVPWRVAFALQADGWVLRSDVVWHKPNPMPESVTDRPTKAHEYLFLFAKSPRYYYDADAIREPSPEDERARTAPRRPSDADAELLANGYAGRRGEAPRGQGANRRTVWTVPTRPYAGAHFATFPPALVEPCILAGSARQACGRCGAPYARLVERTTIREQGAANLTGGKMEALAATGARKDGLSSSNSHDGTNTPTIRTLGYAPACGCNTAGPDILPDDLEVIDTPTGERAGEDPSRVVGRAGMSRPRGDNEGRRPITRYQQRAYAAQLRASPHAAAMATEAGAAAFDHYKRTDRAGARPIPPGLLDAWTERGWLEPVDTPDVVPPAPAPSRVLDPFNGAGTTGLVAIRHGRAYIGIELNPEYAELARDRIETDIRTGHRPPDRARPVHDGQVTLDLDLASAEA